ncbi:glycosyltransferase [Dermabacteraceae bacterium P13147]
MHVLTMPSWYPRQADDLSGSFFAEQVRILREAGERVAVIPVSVAYGRPALLSAHPDVYAHVVGTDVPRLPRLTLALLWAQASQVLTRYVRENGKPDLIHAHTLWPAGFIAARAARKLGVPLVITEHRPAMLERCDSPALAALSREVLGQAAAVSAVSDGFAARLAETFGLACESVKTLPNPLAEAFGAPLPDSLPQHAGYRFCHVSHLTEVKRVPEMIAAFLASGLAETCEFVIAGGSPEKLARLRAAYPVRERTLAEVTEKLLPGVTLVGPLPRAEVRRLYLASDAFVLNSSSESFGIVLAEALSCGLDVIASDTWGARQVLSDGVGTLVAQDEPDALAQSLRAARKSGPPSRELRRERSEYARERFSPASYVANARALWHQALSTAEQTPRCLVITTWYPSENNPRVGSFVREDVRTLGTFAKLIVVHCDPTGSVSGWDRVDGVPVLRLPLRWRSPLSIISCLRQIARQARRADVVHTMAFPAALLLRTSRPWQRRRVPWLHTEHWSLIDRLAEQKKRPLPGSLVYVLAGALIVAVLRGAYVSVAVSERLRTALRTLGLKSRSEVIGNYVSRPASFPETRRPGALRVIGVGGLVPGKNPLLVADVLGALAGSQPVELTWLGEGPLAEELRARCAELGVPLRLRGAVAKDEVSRELLRADLFFVPTRGETFFLSAAEALAHGIPVLTSDSGAQREFLSDTAARMLSLDAPVSAWADALCGLYARSRKMSRREIAETVRGFSREALASRYRQLYREALHGPTQKEGKQ